MKKIISLCICVSLILLSACTDKETVTENEKALKSEEIRGVWIFYQELSMKSENGGTEKRFTDKMNKIFDNCLSLGINTVFFHVRPFSDSFYPSDIFPMSEYLTGEQGKNTNYDPLKIAVECAHERDIALHAWINPFRISFSNDINKISSSNPSRKLIEEKSSRVCEVNNGFYYNPSCEENHKLIIDGVREIVNHYDIDGIHIDDYFYPDTDKSIDSEQYNEYINNGGKLSLDIWRMQNIDSFVSSMYSAVKSLNSDVIVSISPAGNIENNYNSLYADVKKWGSTIGYCDWLIPQLYFDFNNNVLPYETALNNWRKITTCENVKLLSGLGAYKVNEEKSGDWASSGIIERQYNSAVECGYDGFVLFSYTSIISEKFGNNADFLSSLK